MIRESAVAGLIFLFCVFFAYQNIHDTEAVPTISFLGEINEKSSSVARNLSLTERVELPPISEPKNVLFVGDIMLARDVETHLNKKGSDYAYRRAGFLKTETSYVVGNFEAAIPKSHYQTKDLTFAFSVSIRHLAALRQAGFTHLSLANNHTVDFGVAGYSHTKAALATADLRTFGDPYRSSSSSLAVIEISDKKIALIGMQTVFSSSRFEDYLALITEVSATTDFQVVYIHWGNEYELRPSITEQTLAKRLVQAGADLIVGHHPHVTQSIEKIDSSIVVYSLGNFIFDQYFSLDVQEGLAISLAFPEGVPRIDLLPISSLGYRAQPGLMNRPLTDAFLANLASRSSPLIAEMITEGTIIYDYVLASSTEIAIMD